MCGENRGRGGSERWFGEVVWRGGAIGAFVAEGRSCLRGSGCLPLGSLSPGLIRRVSRTRHSPVGWFGLIGLPNLASHGGDDDGGGDVDGDPAEQELLEQVNDVRGTIRSMSGLEGMQEQGKRIIEDRLKTFQVLYSCRFRK